MKPSPKRSIPSVDESSEVQYQHVEEFRKRFRPFTEAIEALTEDRAMLAYAFEYIKYCRQLRPSRSTDWQPSLDARDPLSQLAARIEEINNQFRTALMAYIHSLDELGKKESIAACIGIAPSTIMLQSPARSLGLYTTRLYLRRELGLVQPVSAYRNELSAIVDEITIKITNVFRERPLSDFGIPVFARPAILRKLHQMLKRRNKVGIERLGGTRTTGMLNYLRENWGVAAAQVPEIHEALEEYRRRIADLVARVMDEAGGNYFLAGELLGIQTSEFAHLYNELLLQRASLIQ